MDNQEKVVKIRKLSQKFAFSSVKLHEIVGEKIGLFGTDHKYLGFFVQKGKMTADELALVTGLTTGAVTGLIDRFEKRKLVKRESDKNDRRKIIINPNIEKITNLLTPIYQDFQDNIDELFNSFTINELEIIEKYFTNALEIVDKKIENLNEK